MTAYAVGTNLAENDAAARKLRMTTAVFVKRNIRAPFSATIELLQRLHKGAHRSQRVGPFPLMQARVQCEIATTRDYTDQARIHDALVVMWRARGHAALPRMRGLITVRPNGPFTSLRLEGSYHPPFGWIGGIFDGLIGRRIAQRTAERLLAQFGDVVQRAWDHDVSWFDSRSP